MGYEEIQGIKSIVIKDMSAGWFPGKSHNDIPGSLTNEEEAHGMYDGNAVVWFDGGLKSFFGYDNVNSSALNSGATVTSLFASNSLSQIVVSCGDKLYSGADQASPTDITGSVVITADYQIQWVEWQFETTKYIVGANGVDPLIKWTGTGNADVLSGSPPTGRWLAVWNDALWVANTSTEPSTIYFSDLTDPEGYTEDNDYKFHSPITGLGVLGDKLFVFKEDSIGMLSGTNNILLDKIENYVSGKGCVAGHTIVNARIDNIEVLIFKSADGFYAIDGSSQILNLSHPIRNKYRSQSDVALFNQARFQYAIAEYWPNYEWYVCCLSDSDDTTNNFMIILDLSRVYRTKEGIYVPHWPIDNIPGNCMARSKSVTSQRNEIFFGDTTGFVYKFDPATFNYNGSSYNKYYKSKIYDNVTEWIIMEYNLMGTETNTTMTNYINSDLETGDGTVSTMSFLDSADLLDVSFVWDQSVWGGKDFVFNDSPTDEWGRFLQFRFGNAELDKSFNIKEINLVLQEIGVEPNAAQE